MSDGGTGLFDFTSVPDGYRHYLQPAVFDPWARQLLAFAPPAPGGVILDVASGTGAVAHAAALVVGPTGRVIASDVSPLMLAQAGRGPAADRAAVEPLESPADHLALPDGSVDALYCQQGLQFMPDRAAVVAEMRRVLRPGGIAAVAVWAEGAGPEPFAGYARLLAAHGVPEPYPAAYDMSAVTMSAGDLEAILTSAGLDDVVVQSVELPLVWPDPDAAAHGITGSTYGPTVASLSPAAQAGLFAAVVAEAVDQPAPIMRAVLGRAVAR